MTNAFCSGIVLSGGDNIHKVILFVLSVFLSYSYFLSYFSYIKSNSNNSNNSNSIKEKKFYKKIKEKLKKEEIKLKNIGNPYNFKINTLIFIKYIFAPIISFYLFFIHKNILISLIYFLFIYNIPNILIKSYLKKEDSIIFKDVKLIIESTILLLGTKMPVYNALIEASKSIKNQRLKKEFSKMLDEYEMLGYSFKNVTSFFNGKFASKELKLLISTIANGENEGNLEEKLKALNSTTEITYMKKTKNITDIKKLKLYFFSILCMINIVLLVIYPIIIQITQELKSIFS